MSLTTASYSDAKSPVLRATSTSGLTAVEGDSDLGYGVYGNSSGGAGVYGNSSDNTGVQGWSDSRVGVNGASKSGIGVEGDSSSGIGVRATNDEGNEYALSAEAFGGYLVAQFKNVARIDRDRTALVDWLSGDNVRWRVAVGGTNNGFGLTAGQFYLENPPGTIRLLIDSKGNIGVGTAHPSHLIHLNGGAYCDGTGAWISGSSVRWKENIEPLTAGVEMLKQLHPVAYNRKETPAKKTMGFIAEEVGKVLPTVVDWDRAEPGYAEGYDHLAILAVAVQAIKELTTTNNEQQAQIGEQKAAIEQLEERTAFLERIIKRLAPI